jgi:hypothetical protein
VWHIFLDGLFLTAVGWLITELISYIATPNAISSFRQFDNEIWTGWSQLDPFSIAKLYWQNFWPDQTFFLVPLEALVKTIIALWNTGGVARVVGLVALVLGASPIILAISVAMHEMPLWMTLVSVRLHALWIALGCAATIAIGSVAALIIQGFMLATAFLLNFVVNQFDMQQQPISNAVSSTSLIASFSYHCLSRGSEHTLSALAVGGIRRGFRALSRLFDHHNHRTMS